MRSARPIVATVTLLAGTALLAVPPVPASAAAPTCAGRRATIVGTSGPDSIVGTAGADVIVGLGGADTVEAKGGRDLVCGGAGSDIIIGQGGDDDLRGEGDMDALEGMGGDDVLRGGSSIDLAAFLTAKRGVVGDVRTGTARGAGRDTLVGTEGFIGSAYDDSLRGDAGLNAFFGHLGDDSLAGRAGPDWIFYGLARHGVAVDLAFGSGSGGEGEDGLSSMENAVGSPFDDTLLGDEASNYLDGVDGYDVVDGRGGDNLCYGEERTGCYQDVIPTSGSEPSGDTGAGGTAPARDALDALAASRPVPGPTVGEPPGGVPAPKELPSRQAYTYVNCPMLTGALWFNLPRWDGFGYYAFRAYRPLTGYDEWTYSPWLWYGNGGWQVYFNGVWYVVPQTYVVIPGGTSLPIEVWYYYEPNSQWYSMGGCNTTAAAFGIDVVATRRASSVAGMWAPRR